MAAPSTADAMQAVKMKTFGLLNGTSFLKALVFAFSSLMLSTFD